MKVFALSLLVMLMTFAFADDPEHGAFLPAQAAADVLKDYAGADGAFLGAGLIKKTYVADDLSTLLQYPTDELVIVKLNGAQIKQALERSLSLYPEANSSFLQLSGFDVVFAKVSNNGQHIVQVKCNGSDLDESKNYQIAMPSSLGRGGLGYFKIWDKAKITKTFSGVTVETVLKGKRYVETSPRWVASGS
ncbi:MAG: hypothetical protein BGO01_06235 [Armatimonadetes bacterium 55-13]|nr:5'-nucleotidase C-terminal domain-containing protein [Armatimonadota bacterium]OJU65080.1 MAG: hypothetical protein BGO01_06235 [Armatimonadetes bacterium 55-13]